MADQNARLGQVPEIELLFDVEQIVQHAGGEVAQIGGAFAEIFVLDRFQHGDVAVGGGVKGVVGVGLLLADDLDDLLDEHAVFEHEQVGVENIRLGGTHRVGDAALDFGDLLAGADEGVLEALDFLADRILGSIRAGRWRGGRGARRRLSPCRHLPKQRCRDTPFRL